MQRLKLSMGNKGTTIKKETEYIVEYKVGFNSEYRPLGIFTTETLAKQGIQRVQNYYKKKGIDNENTFFKMKPYTTNTVHYKSLM